ncbi:MAG: Gldg family protein [Deltaproteobacteria bacterium]|nr:Gldg family protein [Deltaproteobacteria bacterium]
MSAKNQFQSYIKLLTYLIAIVLINVAGITLFSSYRIDLTENRIYSISKASQRVVSTLSEPLTIKVFFSKNLPAPHNNTERYLHDLLEEYAIHANRYFNYRFYDVSADKAGARSETDENQQIAKNYGIHPVQIQNIEKDEVKFQKAYMGLVIIHGDMIEKIPTITSTDGLEYQLTTSIQKLNNKISALINLEGKILIKLFLSSSLKIIAPYLQLDELPALPEKLEETVAKLNAKTYGKLAFEYFDPSEDEGLEPVLKEYNILGLNWPALSNGQIQPGDGHIGLVTEYGDKAITTPLIDIVRIPLIGTQYSMVEIDKMEEIINENIESIIDINEDIGYLADHGTPGAPLTPRMNPLEQEQSTITTFRNLASRNYTIRDIYLKDGTIPDRFNCFIIAGPTETFTDYELFQIDQFLMRGNNLALFLDSFNEINHPRDVQAFTGQRGPEFVPINTGLEKLLDHYGVRAKKSYVLDENCFIQRTRTRMGDRETPYYFVPRIKNEFINNDLEFMKGIKEMVVMKASPLKLEEKRIEENGLKATQLLASSEKSWEMSGRINLNPMFIHPPSAEEMQSLPLAYLIEGEFPSYFAGKPIPEKEPDDAEASDEEGSENKKPADKKPDEDLAKIEGEGQVIPKGRPAKIFLIASSEVLKNSMLDEEGRSPNATFIMNVLDTLNGRDETAVMRSKEQRFNPLEETEPAVKTFVKSFNIVGLPVFVVVFGLIVWLRRRSRQKRIRLMFQK